MTENRSKGLRGVVAYLTQQGYEVQHETFKSGPPGGVIFVLGGKLPKDVVTEAHRILKEVADE